MKKLPPSNKNMTVRKGSIVEALCILGLGVVIAVMIIAGRLK